MITLGLDLPTHAEIRREREERRRQEAAADARQRRAGARSFEAARLNRLNRDWSTVNTSANIEARRSLRVLRARARVLARNSPYIKRFLSMLRNNVAGHSGIRLQARAETRDGEQDRVLNRAVERAWAAWSHPENCSVTGRMSWADAQRKYWTTLGRDGEVLVRMVPAQNPFGMALRFVSVDWLDETFCERLPGGNRVIMSVEVDADDRPVAYWLTPPPADYQFLTNTDRRRTRVEASEVIHDFLLDDATSDDDCQTRGVPWLHAVMARLKMLEGYLDAEVIASRAAACKMGFFIEQAPDEDAYTGDEEGCEREQPRLMDSAQPATFGVVPAGYDFKEYDPNHPNTAFGDFVKEALRGVATGLDVNYFALNQDYGDVTYSSARIGLRESEDVWRALQLFQAEHFNRRVYLNWLKASMLSGAVRITTRDYERLNEPRWQPRGWKWVDPLKEVQANVLAINNCLETLSDVVAEQGRDVEETLEARAREQKIIEQKGVKVVAEKPALAAPKNDPEED